MALTTVQLPAMAWNCHMHLFDPVAYPFKPTRSYTPEAAPMTVFMNNALTENAIVVQATVEDGHAGLLDHLGQARALAPERTDMVSDAALRDMTDAGYDALHGAGVRGLRIHGSYGGSGDDNATWVQGQFVQAVAQAPIRRLGWLVTSQLSLVMWAVLADVILNGPLLADAVFVADHNGSARPQDIGSADLDAFLRLLRSGRFYVKVGALHRRSPGNLSAMRPIIETFASTAPDALLWGSGWPHVNATATGLAPAPPLRGVDTGAELELLREWLTDDQWEHMFVTNPARAFGVDGRRRA
ncbi:hypothetical protein GGTG_13216 [Gaeumannomyces tritici R3-111a-1]|uniref:Amidohydrolase-related domain-containing protein n=1 Tax=Gaeumannomyces tritici (strain R3-111a-1) TaxID=644352 RepID=J3PI88_GAET3|nr:hypothetical protein GGTG_13216 [Gaeumannomyces tritici R3-111a-1]EJT69600.1 hypothetical protein GGTG_13216 [Gaeumannomyces tritici R3-111a-1]